MYESWPLVGYKIEIGKLSFVTGTFIVFNPLMHEPFTIVLRHEVHKSKFTPSCHRGYDTVSWITKQQQVAIMYFWLFKNVILR